MVVAPSASVAAICGRLPSRSIVSGVPAADVTLAPAQPTLIGEAIVSVVVTCAAPATVRSNVAEPANGAPRSRPAASRSSDAVSSSFASVIAIGSSCAAPSWTNSSTPPALAATRTRGCMAATARRNRRPIFCVRNFDAVHRQQVAGQHEHHRLGLVPVDLRLDLAKLGLALLVQAQHHVEICRAPDVEAVGLDAHVLLRERHGPIVERDAALGELDGRDRVRHRLSQLRTHVDRVHPDLLAGIA